MSSFFKNLNVSFNMLQLSLSIYHKHRIYLFLIQKLHSKCMHRLHKSWIIKLMLNTVDNYTFTGICNVSEKSACKPNECNSLALIYDMRMKSNFFFASKDNNLHIN